MCCKGFSSSIQRILPIAIIVLIGNVNVVANCGDKIASSPPDSVELNAEVMNPEWDLRSTDSIMISWGNPVQRILCYNKKIRATGHHGHSMDWRMDDNTLVVAAIPKAEKYTVIFSFQGKQRGAELIGTGGKVKLKDWAWPAPPALAIAPVHAPTPVPVVVPTTTTTPSATTTPAPVVIPTTTTVPSTAPTSARVIVPTTTTIPSTTPTPAATATTQPEAPAPMNSTPAIEPSKPGIRPMKKGLIVNKGDSCTVAAGLAVFTIP